MSKVHANVVFSNECVLLKHMVPIWNTYPVDEWVFYDDNSTDNSVQILSQLNSKVTIINDNITGPFNETYSRNRLLEYSRDNGAEFVIALDADEFISTNALEEFDTFLNLHKEVDLEPYWYNFVEDVHHIRQDPMYVNNYKSFVMHVPNTRSFKEFREVNIHCARTAPSNLKKVQTKKYGLMHLQALNRKFYALKQLWYKHWEYHDFNIHPRILNMKYDPVVNMLNFNKTKIPNELIKNIEIDANIFDELLEIKGYKKYVLENLVPELITFGQEYLIRDI